MLACLLTALLPLSVCTAATGEDARVRQCTGLYFDTNSHLSGDACLLDGHSFFADPGQVRGHSFGIWRNFRFFKGFYYQPELAYLLYNGEDERRITALSITPVQIQLGLHLGWVRPFVCGGGSLNIALNARNEAGTAISLGSLPDRSNFGYFYGGGLDILSFCQVNFRLKHWLADTPGAEGLTERSIGVAFFF